MILFYIFLILTVVFSGAILLERHLRDPAAPFREEAYAQGMDFEEVEAGVGIRVALAQLRRLASDLCMLKRGEITRAQIDEIATHLAIGLGAAHNHEAAKTFLALVRTMPEGEILYADAREAWMAWLKPQLWKIEPDKQLAADLRAAFRVQS